ncbi:MAG: hypothetical protein ABI878_00330 [Acidobacteriota bacterium]
MKISRSFAILNFIHGSLITGVILFTILLFTGCEKPARLGPAGLRSVTTLAGIGREFGEPYGVAAKDGIIYVSDGQNGRILTITPRGIVSIYAQGLDTPSGIAFNKQGELLVADSGSNSIKKIDEKGATTTIAGMNGKPGYVDGDVASAQFHAPIGIAVSDDGGVYVADTYNDRIRLIRDRKVFTIAGGGRGFADGPGSIARFNTPCGLALLPDGDVVVADLGNFRIRVVTPDGTTSTLIGSGRGESKDGPLGGADTNSPTAVAVDQAGSIFFADGNAIRLIQNGFMPRVTTIAGRRRGLLDGARTQSQFNRPSGIAVDSNANVFVADSDNQLVRVITVGNMGKAIEPWDIDRLRMSAEEFRTAAPARWPYDPPGAKREVAGTLGELRGEIRPGDTDIHFHNGLDVVGGYGETARFVRDEKVLLPLAVDNFGTLREMIRMPTMGYIHIRIGRFPDQRPFQDPRFVFDGVGSPTDVRVPRGSSFKAGEPIGTLNPMNHVHLIAGRSGTEMNSLDALILPGIADGLAPAIEKVTLFDENWHEIETAAGAGRIRLAGKVRVVAKAYDRMDGNADRRRLGVYSVGYAVYDAAGNVVTDHRASILFKRMPDQRSITFVYANGSRSAAPGETIFNYIATNEVAGDSYQESFLDLTNYQAGQYSLKVFASDYFGNTATKDIAFEVAK